MHASCAAYFKKKGSVTMPYSIMLDAGHGGRDPGAVYNGRQEKDDTLRLTPVSYTHLFEKSNPG